MEPCLLREDRDSITLLTLNRPQARNSLSLALLRALQSELGRLDQTRVLIIAGAGPAFCAGHDLKEISASGFDPTLCSEIFQCCSAVMQALPALSIPVIAQVHGVATAAGCQLVASCDLAVAAEDARFATPGVNIGLFCSTPMVALSRNVGRKAALQMLLTGDPIDAAKALAIGLISEIAPKDRLTERCWQLARQLAGKSAATLAIGKQAFYRQIDMSQSHAYDAVTKVMTDNLQHEDAQEGINAFLDKRAPQW